MRLNTQAWSRLDGYIAADGEDEILSAVCGRIAEGESPHDVSHSMGITWTVMRRWLEDDKRRHDEYQFAKRCLADKLQWEGLRVVMESGVEQVPLARLQSERMDKMASRLDRVTWGDEKVLGGGFGGGGITIVIGDVVKDVLPAPAAIEVIPQEVAMLVIEEEVVI